MASLPIYICEVPEYAVRDGHMHIRIADLEMAMPVSVWSAGVARGQAAMDEWRIEQSGKVERLDDWRGHAASS